MGRTRHIWQGRRSRWLIASLLAIAGHLAVIVAVTPTSRPTYRHEPTVLIEVFTDPERPARTVERRPAERTAEAHAESDVPRQVPQSEVPAPAENPAQALAPPASEPRRVEAPAALFPPGVGRAGCLDPRTGRALSPCDLGPSHFGPPSPQLALSLRAREFEAGKAQRNGGPIELGGGLSLRHRNGRQVPLHENRCEGGNLGMNCLEESAVGIVSQKF